MMTTHSLTKAADDYTGKAEKQRTPTSIAKSIGMGRAAREKIVELNDVDPQLDSNLLELNDKLY